MLRIIEEALTFDDVLLVPKYSEITARDVTLYTRLTTGIRMNIPLLSAAMDTVTESRLAIAIAQEGGIGIVHKSMSPDHQAREVWAVKKYESGVVKNPFTIEATATLRDLHEFTEANNISGVPILKNGALIGIVTRRDVRFVSDMDALVTSVMTPRDRLVTVKEGVEADVVRDLFREHRIEKVLVVNDDFELRGLITVTDIDKAEQYPDACKDDQGRLRVGASVGVAEDSEERIAKLVEAQVDVLVLDTAHGHSKNVINRVHWIKSNYPQVQIIGGNVATADGARALADAGVDGVKVGIGPGSICTTRVITGIGVPQVSAIAAAADALRDRDIPVIADGGIRFSGDMAKAIAAGASSVMMGSMLAGTEEAPGEIEIYQGRSYKSYRGMGSLGAMSRIQGSSDRYFQHIDDGFEKLVPEGIEGRVPYKGPLTTIIHQMMGGLRSAMGYTGCSSIEQMRTEPTFVRVTSAGIGESHVHDVHITKEAPNYPVRAG
ncbi:MAG: IMP dehydrogenase [Cellvibrionales bacterium TMED49]|nr:IMP dehydrogenase [Porticoccaceae bacterium]OUU39395.1 MAG: IMP dehydrogenase [Cellvibrionales bacterium TMED49]